MDNSNPGYRSFMLRLWIEQTNGKNWRFSLEDAFTGKRKGFASLIKLIAYLDELTSDVRYYSNREE
jgi:hypothetical protein